MIDRTGSSLQIGGIDATAIADRYDTPLYVYDQETILERYHEVRDAFQERYSNFRLHYAVKANSNPAILDLLKEEGAGFDCASPAELWLMDQLDVPRDSVLYTGLYNREDELAFAQEQGMRINLDSRQLLEKLDQVPETLSFRVNPGIGRGKNGLVFAGENSKFGVPEERVVDAYRAARDRGVERFGMHMMTGSCILDPDYFQQITERLLEIAGRVRSELGISFEFIDIGGGLGIPYEPEEERLPLEETAEKVTSSFRQGIEDHNLGEPDLIMEPGRYIVAESGVLLTRVTGTKQATGGKEFVGIDTGMHHLIRPMLLDAYHEIVVANDLEREKDSAKNVVGPVCSNTDIMAEERNLPTLEQGDLLGIMDAGAYGFTMASNWNTRRLPPEILVDDGSAELIRDRQSFEQLFQNTSYFQD
ncbi:MAG: diaminopimelate decarboxylase [Candidatus Nanohaloarchaea archaeon]|nr:diaminopimelate decarboxylase [Candidatus Nanohaloarchaea archaeon]